MTKKQFLEELRCALKGELPENEIKANVEYYNDYITESVQRGRSEQQVFDELGSPQWIARTIITSYEADRTYQGSGYEETAYESRSSSYYQEDKKEERKRKWLEKFSEYLVNGFPWYYKAAGIAMLIVVLAVLWYIGSVIMGVIVRIAIPILLVYMLYMIWKTFFKK